MAVRPRSAVREGALKKEWRYLILDGYVDEPASLGVPPYISPQVRSLAGGLVNGGADPGEVGYLTVDQWRGIRGRGDWNVDPKLEFIIAIKGCVVPGKYLRGTPISSREIAELTASVKDASIVLWGSGSYMDGIEGDPGVLGENIASEGNLSSRDRTMEEWGTNLRSGAFIIQLHPDFPTPLIAEIETSRGCPRYMSGGCSFCIEPTKGPVQFREPQDIASEVAELADRGLENIRIGGQSDLVSYMTKEAGISETPTPDPRALTEMMTGCRKALHSGPGLISALEAGRRLGIDTGIVHTDNANPAVIADHPDEAMEALGAIAMNCTPGSVLALGLESADPAVKEANNLNSDPGQTMEAIRAINAVGRHIGGNGMPQLLPGLNFLGGLKGQYEGSFEHDLALLERVRTEGLLLRRINIRAAMYPRPGGAAAPSFPDGRAERAFRSFKEGVRGSFDSHLLSQVIPEHTLLKGVYLETTLGRSVYGRQIGSYPVLVRMDHPGPTGTFADVHITGISGRSVSGFGSPFMVNRVPFSHLLAIPGIGRKRAASVFRKRPIDMEYLGRELGIDRRVLADIRTER
jgi:radical SAM superfamily enzyme with C-terminal helix-hairpin-helix motif